MNKNIKIKLNFLEPRKKNYFDIEPSAHPFYLFIKNLLLYMTKTWRVGGRHMSNTNNIIEYGKINPQNKNLFKIIKGTCSICDRKKFQIFTK